VGFDQDLDLEWTVPITEDLVKSDKLLEALEGEDLVLSVGGTTAAPTVAFDDALPSLVERTLEKRITGPLDVLLGKSDENPAALLAEADRLWAADLKVEAQVIYKRLREEFRLTPVYYLNKKRIKDRAKGKD
jgi:hypothetical protein